MASRRTELLEFAILGLLHESPLHGYELRKRLNLALGPFRALSYGTLYPCLRGLLDRGLIQPEGGGPVAAVTDVQPTAGSVTTVSSAGKRARLVYELTADGKEHFQRAAAQTDASAWDDDGFDVRFAFFARTEAEVRLRILEGRRSRLEERLGNIRAASARGRARMDTYTAALQQHGEDAAEREVRWLTELITAERGSTGSSGPSTPT